MKTKLFVALRWIAVFPAAILSSVIMYFAVFLFMQLMNWFWFDTTHSVGAQIGSDTISGFFMGAGFIQGGVFVAPYNRKITARVLAYLGLAIQAAYVAFVIYSLTKVGWRPSAGWAILSSVFAALGLSVFGFKEYDDKSFKFFA